MTSPSPCIALCSRVRVKCSACSALAYSAAECDQATARAVCRKCFTSIAIDRARRSSPVVRSCQRSIASVSTASKRCHLLEVLPWLNFTPDNPSKSKRSAFHLALRWSCLAACASMHVLFAPLSRYTLITTDSPVSGLTAWAGNIAITMWSSFDSCWVSIPSITTSVEVRFPIDTSSSFTI